MKKKLPLVEDVLSWSMAGFDKVGKIGLINKTEAEPMTGMQ